MALKARAVKGPLPEAWKEGVAWLESQEGQVLYDENMARTLEYARAKVNAQKRGRAT